MSVRIKTYPYGPLGANMYAVFSDTAFIVIDPCVDPSKVDTDLQLEAIFITHGHFDHFSSLDEWKAKYPDAPVYLHEDDIQCLSSSKANLSSDFGYDCSCAAGALPLSEVKGKTFLGEVTFDYLHTPGHSKGSSCLLFTAGSTKLMFSGDMLFSGSIGRTDLYGSSVPSMMASITALKEIKEQYEVYPGHGPATMLQREKATNPFFRGMIS